MQTDNDETGQSYTFSKFNLYCHFTPNFRRRIGTTTWGNHRRLGAPYHREKPEPGTKYWSTGIDLGLSRSDERLDLPVKLILLSPDHAAHLLPALHQHKGRHRFDVECLCNLLQNPNTSTLRRIMHLCFRRTGKHSNLNAWTVTKASIKFQDLVFLYRLKFILHSWSWVWS